MTTRIKINVTGKSVSSALGLCILIALSLGVLARSIPDPGHTGDSILVSIGGQEITLQEAITREYVIPKQSEIDYSQCTEQSGNCAEQLTCPENYAVIQVNRGESCGFFRDGSSYPSQIKCCKIG